MRDTNSWRRELRRNLTNHRLEIEQHLMLTKFCDIELGLYLLSQLVPQARADSLWMLLTGYQFPIAESYKWNEQQKRMLGNVRHILTQFRSNSNWKQALKVYCQLDESLRGYEIDAELNKFSQRNVSVVSKRFQIYANALNRALPYSHKALRWVTEAGLYECESGRYQATVDISQELIFQPPTGHNLTGRTEREPIVVTWDALKETACWMDSILCPELVESEDESKQKQTWEYRISRVTLELLSSDSTYLTRSQTLTLEGLMHLIGMVSSGKSTLMTVLTVLLVVTYKMRVTIVVGDVINALEQAKIFQKLNIKAAPVLGTTNRDRHTNRLHRAWNSENPYEPLSPTHPGFQWLSTACPISERRRDIAQPFAIRQQPCLKLSKLNNSDDEEEEDNTDNTIYACPVYSVCPFHKAQVDLVEAQVTIATPASLVYTRVAPQINSESIRFMELVYRLSDVVIIDEVDQVQVQLDNIFSPNQKLFGPGGDGWFSQVHIPVVEQLNLKGRGQLVDSDVDAWCQAHDIAQTATSRIYALLLQKLPALEKWEKHGDYFTSWILLSIIASTVSGEKAGDDNERPVYQRLMDSFENYLEDPLGDQNNHPLAESTRRLLATTNKETVLNNLKQWILDNKEPERNISEETLKNTVIQLEFALLVAALQERLNSMLRDWKSVEEPFKLESGSSLLFHTPPRDYEPVMPTAPMGNVLAFQYICDSENPPGDLRFFKCLGVGRWLLLHFHELFASDGIAGPHVMLLSGTSWAGTSPGYHVQVPVAGVLRSPDEELEAIKKSKFRFEQYYYDEQEQRPITISGAKGHERVVALKELLNKLALPGGLGGKSRLEVERDRLPPGRERILLLVGSYEQAKLVQEHLEKIRPEWSEQVLRLVCDDEEFGSEWQGSKQSIQRGLVSKFASTGAWILIAPLMAIERGHNILNEVGKAAFGAAYFLVRPHPRPDDINFAIQSINRWAVEKHNNASWLRRKCEDNLLKLDKVGEVFRKAAYRRWRHLLKLPMIYSTLPDNERNAITWNQLVSIWQVIGRLVRGGSPARIIFCDAAFARRTAYQDEQGETSQTSLLVSIKEVLRPYFLPDFNPNIPDGDKALVQALYGPFYQAIENIGGIAE